MRTLNLGRFLAVGALLALTSIVAMPVARAQEQTDPLRKFRGGEDIIVPVGEVMRHDLYAAGNRVRIDGRIEGDLFAVAEQIDINGTVEGDVFAGANRVTIAGQVSGDVRTAGASVLIAGNVREDVLAAAGAVTLIPAGQIGHDLTFVSGQTVLNGRVDGSVLGRTENYTRQGSIAGTESVTVEEPKPEAPPPTLLDQVLGELRRYVSILVIGGLLLLFASRRAQRASLAVRQRALVSFGAGILAVLGFAAALIGLIVAAVLLSIPLGLFGFGSLVATTIIGGLLASGVLSFAFAIAVVFLANVVVGLAIGLLLLGRGTAAGVAAMALALPLGLLLVVLVEAIPVVGGVLNALIVLVGLGALFLSPPSPPVAEPPPAHPPTPASVEPSPASP